MDDLNKMLAEAEANAAHAETLARQLEAEIKKIPGAAASLPKRQYGTPVSSDSDFPTPSGVLQCLFLQ